MKYLIACFSFLLFSILQMDAQRREFHPTIDVGINGGISLSEFNIDEAFSQSGKMKQFNFNVMSNAGFSRHLFEVDFANPLNENEFNINPNESYKPSFLSINYTFGYELFAYYPACMIRNQLLLGLRLNTEFWFGDYVIENFQEGNDHLFLGDDFGQYSADITLLTDYHLNKKNYIVLQVYSPIVSLISSKIDHGYRTKKEPLLWSVIEIDAPSLFKRMEFVGLKGNSKIGVLATYRLLLSDNVAVQLKYHGKFNNKTNYSEFAFSPLNGSLYQNHHQFMVGIVGHIKRMPIGF